jgi:hypothetical protein
MFTEQLLWLRNHFYVDLRSQSVGCWQLGLHERSSVGSHGDPYFTAGDVKDYMYGDDVVRLVDAVARCKGWPSAVDTQAPLSPLYLPALPASAPQPCPDGYEIVSPYGNEIAALREQRGLAHDCARLSITKRGELVTMGGEREGMRPAAWTWLTQQWMAKQTEE